MESPEKEFGGIGSRFCDRNEPEKMMREQTEHELRAVVCRRTRMDDLADVLIEEVYAEIRNSGDLFRRVRVIVPNRSIQRYLSLRFAHRHEVTAQIEFLPLMSVFSRFMPRNSVSGRLNIDEKTIGWRIYRILMERDSEAAFPQLVRWIGGDAKKLYELSRQLGSLYDKYILYRPEWIGAWEAGRMPRGLEGEPVAAWQGELWRRVAGEDWKGNHFAAVYGKIMRGEPGLVSGADKAETIRIFGFSQLPPAVLRCLERFSGAGTSVKLYHLVPGKTFFMEDVRREKDELKEFLTRYFHEGQDPDRLREDMETLYFQHNPLVASFAMQSRVLLSGTGDWDGDTDYDYEEEKKPVPEDDTVLHLLQDRIRRDIRPRGVQVSTRKEGSGCRSVQIRSCYSAFREVEAAHNFILHCLAEDPELSIKDIFIMTPSPSEYAPLVDAVFNHSHDTVKLGVSVADRPQTERLPSYNTLMKVLALFKGDFAASEIFGILQDQTLQEHWGITSDDCQYCLTRAMQAGIRWGWDAKEHALSGGKDFPENSWQAGFDRMLLGYALDADVATPYRTGAENEVFPVPGFAGSSGDLLGKFFSLTSKLHEIAQTMRSREKTGMPFLEWYDMLAAAAGSLFGGDSELKKLLLSVLNIWHRVLAEAGAEDVPLTGGIVLAYLQDKHAKPEDNTVGFMRGKITFCGLRPMRSIPADAILLLGMNHRSFPEEDDNREFDIMQQYRQEKDSGAGREPGDPLKRDESRQLFLDTVMAARKYLYISYVGRDIHDRKEKPPSVCVDELQNYLTHEFGKNSFIELKEPIHAFSPELFRNGIANQSFSGIMKEAARQIADPSDAGASGQTPVFDIRGGIHPEESMQAGPSCQSIELDTLRWFFLNPAERFIRDGLDASLSVSEASSPEDSECFEERLDWDVKDELFLAYLESPDRDALESVSLRRLKANGSLPLTRNKDDWQDWSVIAAIAHDFETGTQEMTEQLIGAGEMDFEYSAADAGDLAGLIYDTVPEGRLHARLILPEMKVYRPADPVEPCILMEWSFAKSISGSQLVKPVLEHLRANLDRKTVTKIVYFDGKQISVMTADPMERSDAEKTMKSFLCLYHAGMRKPLPFFPKTSYAFFANEDDLSKKRAAAEKSWNGDYNISGDVDKFGNYFGTELPFGDAFIGLAETFFGAVVFRSTNTRRRGRGKGK